MGYTLPAQTSPGLRRFPICRPLFWTCTNAWYVVCCFAVKLVWCWVCSLGSILLSVIDPPVIMGCIVRIVHVCFPRQVQMQHNLFVVSFCRICLLCRPPQLSSATFPIPFLLLCQRTFTPFVQPLSQCLLGGSAFKLC